MAHMNAKPRGPITAAVIDHIRTGATLGVACSCAGVSTVQFGVWRADDPNIDVQLKEAQAEFELAHIRNIRNHAEKDWKASAWTLERRIPHRYAKKVILKDNRVEVDTGLLVRVPEPTTKQASPEDLQALKAELERAQLALDAAMAAQSSQEGAGDGIPTGSSN